MSDYRPERSVPRPKSLPRPNALLNANASATMGTPPSNTPLTPGLDTIGQRGRGPGWSSRPLSRSRSRSGSFRDIRLTRGFHSWADIFLQCVMNTLYEMGRMVRLMVGVLPSSVRERLRDALSAGLNGDDCPHSMTQAQLLHSLGNNV